MFNSQHIGFMAFASFEIIALLVLCKIFIKDERKKDLVLKIFAVLTVIIHYSTLYVEYFSTGNPTVYATMLFPVYPCNVAMWLLLIVAFYKNKDSKVYKVLAEITFYLGIVGGVIGIMFNEIFADNPTLGDWEVLHGLLSHVTLLFGSIYLLVSNRIKIRVSNVISIFCGLLLLFVDGCFIIGLYRLFDKSSPNCMYLLEPPLESVPWLNTYVIGLIAIVLFFSITAIYEQIALKKEDRWYSKLKNRRKNK